MVKRFFQRFGAFAGGAADSSDERVFGKERECRRFGQIAPFPRQVIIHVIRYTFVLAVDVLHEGWVELFGYAENGIFFPQDGVISDAINGFLLPFHGIQIGESAFPVHILHRPV